MYVRNKLYKVLGCKKTLRILQEEYPEGSIKPEIERRRMKLESETGETGVDLQEQLVEELLRKARK